MATITTDLICNLNQPVAATFLHGNLFSQDNAGNTINVHVMDNGEPATIGGTVSANVIRADGNTVAVSGSMSGNQCSVVLPQACYAVPGRVEIIIKLTQSTTITTIAAIVANVYRSTTDTVVDPGTIIPSIQALIEEIEDAVDSIPVDYSGLLATIAADYSSSKTYQVGQYAWQGGVLKRCIVPITTAETYTAAHWTNAVIGDDLSALKSALNDADSVLFKLEGIASSKWGVGGRTVNTGNRSGATDPLLRINTDKIPATGNVGVVSNSGYQFVLYAWNSEDTYLGWWRNSGGTTGFVKTGNSNADRFYAEMRLADLVANGAATISIVMQKAGGETPITLSDCSNAYLLKDDISGFKSDLESVEDTIGNTEMGTTATTVTGAIAEHETDISGLRSDIESVEAKIGNTEMGTTATTVTGAIAEHEADISGLKNKVGNTEMGTTAPTITGAIAEHETDISALKTKIGNTAMGTTASTVTGAIAEHEVDISGLISGKVNKPSINPNGTSGQLLRTNGDGSTQWVDQGLPTDEQTTNAINAWMDAHPEASTTVQDESLTIKKLVVGALGYVTPGMFDAVDSNGIADIPAMQEMVSFAIENHLDIKLDSDFTIVFDWDNQHGDVDNPTRILIKEADGLSLDGCGYTVTMTGYGTTQMQTLVDPSGSGRDVFTVFSFVLCNDCHIQNINFESDFLFSSGVSYYDFVRTDPLNPSVTIYPPRAKAIGFLGSNNCSVFNCKFDGIWGNAVLMAPSSEVRDGMWRKTDCCFISQCKASNCLENCFNNMAGTENISYDQIVCKLSRQGIETSGKPAGTTDVSQHPFKYSNIITNSYFADVVLGVIANSKDTITGCSFFESGVRVGRGGDCVFSGCIFRLAYLFDVYPKGTVSLVGCKFLGPHEWRGSQESYGSTGEIVMFDASGDSSSAGDYTNVNIIGCSLDFDGYFVENDELVLKSFMAVFATSNVNVADCTINTTGRYALYAANSNGEKYMSNTRSNRSALYPYTSRWTVDNGIGKINTILTPPTTNGNYTLKATVNDGVTNYSWETVQ